jgi:hypothetical protein
MRVQFQALFAASAITFIAGCSSGPMVAPEKFDSARSLGMHRWNSSIALHFKSKYTCPATGAIEYFSDYKNNVINVFAGKFAGQSPCGMITAVSNPQGLFVDASTHDLYVANTGKRNVVVFHRGQLTPYNTYADPTLPFTYEVALAKDGTVIASNVLGPYGGSLSTWIGGPNGGTFVGTFPMTNVKYGYYVVVNHNDLVYYNDLDLTSGRGALWSLRCPHGACGIQTRIAGVSFNEAGGLAISRTNDLLADDAQPGFAETFELPNPNPKTFPIDSGSLDMAIDTSNRHWFALDSQNSDAAEYLYPSGAFVGRVQCAPGCIASGIAVDH